MKYLKLLSLSLVFCSSLNASMTRDENDQGASKRIVFARPLPVPDLSALNNPASREPRWVPQAPVKPGTALYRSWAQKASAQPNKYRVDQKGNVEFFK